MEIFKMFNRRLMFQNSRLLLARFYCDDFSRPPVRMNTQKLQEKSEKSETDVRVYSLESSALPKIQYWNEKAAVKREKRRNKYPLSVNNSVDFVRGLQSLKSLPGNFKELETFLRRRYARRQLIEQKYLPERVRVLKCDLAAAHFIVNRGGSVKFLGNPEWVGYKEKSFDLPRSYVPGMFVEGIKAENTSLITEGLKNLSKLFHLSYLSFKNLETVDDWFLDLLSQEHYMNLKHLDISGCKNVTFRGLSCFYRFESLEILEVKGIPDTTEFKVACLMLLENKPFLDIRGIDLSIPKEIKPTQIKDNAELDSKV